MPVDLAFDGKRIKPNMNQKTQTLAFQPLTRLINHNLGATVATYVKRSV